MVEGFAAEASRLDRDCEVLLEFWLAGEVRESLGTQSGLKLPLVFARGGRNDALFPH